MPRPNPLVLTVIFLVIITVLGGVTLAKGALLIAKHEGDTLHLVQIVLRMAEGQIPHQDFMTPIGALSFAPIALFAKGGAGIGQAFVLAQILVALVLLPMVIWVGISRLSWALSILFGAAVMVLALALVHGEPDPVLSISMHYNRWAWGVAFIVIALAALPPIHWKSQVVDGVIVGLTMAALALLKVTYFAAFLLPVVLGFAIRGQFRALGVGLLAGSGVALAVTIWLGQAYWANYIGDLLTVTQTDVRPFPGRSLGKVLGDPAFLGGSLTAVYAIIALRQAGQAALGALMLLLVPGFFFVTYQNFANDPQWLLLLGVLLLASRQDILAGKNGFGWDLKATVTLLGAAALALVAPSFLNLAYSPFRHMAADIQDYAPILPRATLHNDLMTRNMRVYRVDGRVPIEVPVADPEAFAELTEREEVGSLFDVPLPQCELVMGLPGWFDAVATDLEAAGFAEGRRIFAADLFSSYWLYGSFLPLEGGAPWYYGGLPGFESADYVLVPTCATSTKLRRQIIEQIEARPDVLLEEIRRTPLYILLEKS